MRIGVLGINHKSSELFFRELLAKACQKKLSYETEIAKEFSCVLLSTCNRTEIYFSAEDLAAAQSQLLSVLREEIQESFEHKLYTYFGMDCFIHLALVTSGLDSVILSETEIQRQVKMAYQNTSLYYKLSSSIHYLFQKSLKIGKKVRSSVVITQAQAALPAMMIQMAQVVLGRSTKKRILFIGNSDINRRSIAYFKMKGLHDISLCTRSLSSAQELKESAQIALMDWSELSSWSSYDLIICGTNFSEHLISPKDLKNKEIQSCKLILDLSVPRVVDPKIGSHPQMTLLNMEQLGQMIDQKQKRDLTEIFRAQEMVVQSVHKQLEIFQSKTGFATPLKEQKDLMCV